MFKLIYFPDVISILNGLFGMSAIIFLLLDVPIDSFLRLHIALSLILLGLLADGLDGILARTYGKGELGEYLEAMADMTTMGIAPSVYLVMNINLHHQYDGVLSLSIWAAVLIYLTSSFIRLSSFHPLKNKDVFIGLPASAATLFLLSMSMITNSVLALISSICIISFLMIIPLSFPKPTKLMNLITVLIIIFTIIFAVLFQFMYLFLLSSVVIYMFGGQLYVYFHKKIM